METHLFMMYNLAFCSLAKCVHFLPKFFIGLDLFLDEEGEEGQELFNEELLENLLEEGFVE